MNQRGSFNRQTSFSWSQKYTSGSKNSASSRYMRSCTFGFIPDKSEFSAMEFLKHLAERMARAIRFVSEERRRRRTRRRTRRSNLPQNPSPSLGRSDSRTGNGGFVDSYRSDAVEDCIEFIHSSFSRSNSTANSLTTQ
ncbi:josephin-like protein [Neltuma alba]|uniref:josephin-like protein n=1 Tax=Neltuma alba TaxID=207710 RepID=UPI0010A34840|nr:josephin-like protein [Prosopis alba]